MKIFQFFWTKICADIVWTCNEAAQLCIEKGIFIPKGQICDYMFCLNEVPDLCNQHSIFQSGEYKQDKCDHDHGEQIDQYEVMAISAKKHICNLSGVQRCFKNAIKTVSGKSKFLKL